MPNPITDFLKNRYFSNTSAAGPVQPGGIGQIAKDIGTAAAIYGVINPNDSSGIAKFLGTGGRQQPVGYTGGIPNYTATRELAPNAFAQTYTTPTGEIAPRRPGGVGRRYFTDTTFTQDTGTPFMGITAEQIAAQNQAALDEQALFENILGGVETQRETASAETAAEETAENGTAAADLTVGDAGSTASPEYGAFISQFSGNLTADDAKIIAQSGYPIDVIAQSFNVTPEKLQDFIDYYTPPEGFAQGGNVNGYYLGGPTDGMADQIPATINNMQPAALSDGEFVIPADVVSHLGNGNSDAGAQNLYSMMERVRKDRTGNPKQGKQIDPNKYLA